MCVCVSCLSCFLSFVLSFSAGTCFPDLKMWIILNFVKNYKIKNSSGWGGLSSCPMWPKLWICSQLWACVMLCEATLYWVTALGLLDWVTGSLYWGYWTEAIVLRSQYWGHWLGSLYRGYCTEVTVMRSLTEFTVLRLLYRCHCIEGMSVILIWCNRIEPGFLYWGHCPDSWSYGTFSISISLLNDT